MHEGDGFSAKTLAKSLFHCPNDWSGHGPVRQFLLLEARLDYKFTGSPLISLQVRQTAVSVTLICLGR